MDTNAIYMVDDMDNVETDFEGTIQPGPNEKYCISCGEIISNQAEICPSCGAPQEDETQSFKGGSENATQEGRATAKGGEVERRFKQEIDDKKVEGWDVKKRQGDRVVMIKRRYGTLTSHIVLFIFTFYTFGLANLIYLVYKYFGDADKMVIRKSEFQ